jgi:predicted dehydrogenase
MDNSLRIGLVGVGRGGASSYHARSFSSIINGFDPEKVPDDWPVHAKRVKSAAIEAVWDENRDAAGELARVFSIPSVCNRMEDIADAVDAVLIVDDLTMTHQKKAAFFLEQGMPTFIDKPLTNSLEEASRIVDLAHKKGCIMMSSSALRYAREIEEASSALKKSGKVDCAMAICQGQYMESENLIHYGIHPLELAYAVLGSGAASVQNTGEGERNIVKITYRDGKVLMLLVFPDMVQVFQLQVYGENGHVSITVQDWDYFYWNMLNTFVHSVKNNTLPIPLEETFEIIQVLILGVESLRSEGKSLALERY